MEKDTLKYVFDNFYDQDKVGSIDYKAWASYVTGDTTSDISAKAPHAYSPPKKLGVVPDDYELQVQRSGLNSAGFPLGTTSHLYEPAQTANKISTTNEGYIQNEARRNLKDKYGRPIDSDGNSIHGSSAASYSVHSEDQFMMQQEFAKRDAPKSQLILLQRFKKQLEERGGRGLIGLRRQFKLFDTNGSGALEFNEFSQALNDFEIHLHPKDIENLFKTFDRNGDEKIFFGEFLHTLIGQMTKLRYELVEKAW